MVQVHNFAYGVLNPGLAYVVSCLGCFLGLQCTQRARALEGASRARWLLLAAVSIGVTGIWTMHFIAMLGFTIDGQVIRYNIPVTILSMVLAVAVVAVGLLIVGFGDEGLRPLLIGGTIIGVGVAGMHYLGMYAMRMPDTIHWNVPLVIVSLIIAVVAGTAALWCALHMHGGTGVLIGAALVMGVAVSGMHYTGMAALSVFSAPGGGMLGMGGGVGATSFLLPLILGISLLTFLVTAIVTLAPTPDEIREDAALMERINTLSKNLDETPRREVSHRQTPRSWLFVVLTVTDVTDEDQVIVALAQAVERFGGLDVLFSNAGISGVIAPVAEYPTDVFRRVVDVHVLGAFHLLKHGLPRLRDGASVIINSSVVGLTSDAGISGYATAKHAQVGLMRTVAKEVAARGIRVNTLHPGPTDTEFQREIEVSATGAAPDVAARLFEARIPLSRHACPEEIARCVLFLACADSSFVTGATLAVDGGMHV